MSATDHPIDFVFDSGYGFRGRRIEWTYFRFEHIQEAAARGPPSWKISNNRISRMGYPIHFHELDSSFGEI